VGSNKEQRRIPAHRVVLAAASDIFEAMLFPTIFPEDKKEKDKDASKSVSAIGLGMGLDDKDQEIEITDVKPHIFKLMLQSIYGDTADIKAEDLPELIGCAKKFQLEGLRLLCVTFMEEGVNVDNACTLFESAEKLLNEKQFALSFIEENAAEVIASPTFDALPKERVQTMLRSSKLAIDEIDLFKGVLRWSVAECKRQGKKDSLDNKKEVLADIIPLVRFPAMNMEDVATFVSPSQILSPGQLLEIFTFLGQPDGKKPKTIFGTQPRAGSTDKWTLDQSLKSGSVTLSNKNLTAKNTSSNHSYCLGTQTWLKGVHCWRVTRDAGPAGWLLIGVSRKEAHADSSSGQGGFYGMSSANQRFMGGASTATNTNFANGPLDVMFDADKGTLAVVNLSNNSRAEIQGIPKGTPLCPHFGPHSIQQITVAPLKQRDFGKRK